MHQTDRTHGATPIPEWYAARFGTVAAAFAAMEAARTPDPPVARPFAPVIALDSERLERAVAVLDAMIARKAV